ncbi:MAG: DUF4390 domain-containing protein [Desulfovibrionales bacterium]
MINRALFLLFIAVSVLFVWCGSSRAQTLDLTDMVIDNEEGAVRLRFGIEVDDLMPLSVDLEEGWILELTCRAELIGKRTFFWDKSLGEQEFKSRVDANQLTGEFMVRFAESSRNIQGKNLQRVLEKGWEEIDLTLAPWEKLKKGEEYDLLLEIRLERVDVPVWLKRSLFFWSWEAAPTEVFVLNFRY